MPENIHILSFPRSGTNMFASYLNNHTNIFSVNCGGSRKLNISNDNLLDNSIYANKMNLKKKEIKYVIYDEVKISSSPDSVRKIALIRNYNSINDSIIAKCKKYGWKQPEILKNKYDELVEYAKNPEILGIYIETFIKYPDQILKQVCAWLNIEYQESMHSFEESFLVGCNCGNQFKIKKSNKIFGSLFKKHGYKLSKDEDFFYCEKCNSVIAGFGGFNPKTPMDKSKGMNCTIEQMNKELNN